MAKKKLQDQELNLAPIFNEFKNIKSVNEEALKGILKGGFLHILGGLAEYAEFDILINPTTNDLEINQVYYVVSDEEYKNALEEQEFHKKRKNREIDTFVNFKGGIKDTKVLNITDAWKILEEDAEKRGFSKPEPPIIGDEIRIPFDFSILGRRAIHKLSQHIKREIEKQEKNRIESIFKERIGELISAKVYRVWKNELLLVDDSGYEFILPKSELIQDEYFTSQNIVTAVISEVKSDDRDKLRIIVSRTSNAFLEALFKKDITEIREGQITIKAIARIPGDRAKMAVESYDDRIDPVGACVGQKGFRIRQIVRELRNENIDIINYSSNREIFLKRALSPADEFNSIEFTDNEENLVYVSLPEDQIPLAIGRNTANIKLASELTGYKIAILKENNIEDDVDIELFADEIDKSILDLFIAEGYTTAKQVLNVANEDLLAEINISEETLLKVKECFEKEFTSEDDFNYETNIEE